MDQGVSEPGVKVGKRPPKRRMQQGKRVEAVVTGDWTVAEIIARYPQATEVMSEYGLHCFGCSANAVETLEQGCRGHGFSQADIENLVEDINHVIASTPARPQELFMTKEAALGILEIAKENDEVGKGLSVQANEDGSFFMEFREGIEEGEKEFGNEEVPEVKIWASVLTLQRVGGVTITLKDGRFKLEVGEECGCQKSDCGCK